VGRNSYRVDMPETNPQPLVLINPARMDYRTNPDLNLVQAGSPQAEVGNNTSTRVASTIQLPNEPGFSLIDWTLQRFS